MRQIIGYFKVHSPEGVDRLVVVSQEVETDDQRVVISARKVFTLDTADGSELRKKAGERVFIGKDGMAFRIIGQCHMDLVDLPVPGSRARK